MADGSIDSRPQESARKMNYLEQFFHQITGPSESPKLVFLHGVMGFAANWRRIAKNFEDRYQVLVFDQRGHGRSLRPAVGYSPFDYAEDLRKIIDELGWPKILLVGHSMGGRNALEFASQWPERVEKLVIEDIGPSLNPIGAALVLRLIDSVPVPFESKRAARAWFDAEFLKLYSNHTNPKGLAEYLYANLTENESKQAVWRFYEPGIRESIEQGRAQERWDEIRGLAMPTLLVRGEFSRDLPRETYEEILRVNPRIQGIEIAGAGHWVHSDRP